MEVRALVDRMAACQCLLKDPSRPRNSAGTLEGWLVPQEIPLSEAAPPCRRLQARPGTQLPRPRRAARHRTPMCRVEGRHQRAQQATTAKPAREPGAHQAPAQRPPAHELADDRGGLHGSRTRRGRAGPVVVEEKHSRCFGTEQGPQGQRRSVCSSSLLSSLLLVFFFSLPPEEYQKWRKWRDR